MGKKNLSLFGGYKCILADPPWPERGGGKIKRGADRHYELMCVDEISSLMKELLSWRFHPEACGSHMWLWVTNNFLKQGILLMEELGFRYVTNAVWAKNRMGLGYYLRGQHELLLFGVSGKLEPISKNNPTLIGRDLIKREEHSKKPEQSFDLIESVSPGPRVEIFSRKKRPGWECWGYGVGDSETGKPDSKTLQNGSLFEESAF